MVKLIRVVPILVLGLFVISTTVVAEVERIEITSRSVFADGMEYGAQVSEAAGRLVATGSSSKKTVTPTWPPQRNWRGPLSRSMPFLSGNSSP